MPFPDLVAELRARHRTSDRFSVIAAGMAGASRQLRRGSEDEATYYLSSVFQNLLGEEEVDLFFDALLQIIRARKL